MPLPLPLPLPEDWRVGGGEGRGRARKEQGEQVSLKGDQHNVQRDKRMQGDIQADAQRPFHVGGRHAGYTYAGTHPGRQAGRRAGTHSGRQMGRKACTSEQAHREAGSQASMQESGLAHTCGAQTAGCAHTRTRMRKGIQTGTYNGKKAHMHAIKHAHNKACTQERMYRREITGRQLTE